MMIGIEFVKSKSTKEHAAELSRTIVQKAFDSGLLLLRCGVSTIRLSPPLNTPIELIEEGLSVLESAITEAEMIHRIVET